MNKYVLFSPIGGTDPIRQEYDGPLLHIVRHYSPHKVYLYYTKEMERKRIEVNSALKQFNVEIVEIITGITEPHNYDLFSGVFDKIFDNIQNENKESEILLNITSGTSQIQSALCLEVVTSHLSLKPIQVTTPSKASNENIKHGGDIENNFDELMENGNYLETNRCIEPNILSFRRSSLKKEILSLIEHFEYRVALEKFKNNISLFNAEVYELIKYADLRQNDNSEYNKSKFNSEFNYTNDKDAKIVCDYYCILNNKAKTGEFSYFVLLLKSLSEHIAKDYIGDFKDDEVFNALNKYYLDNFKSEYRPTRVKGKAVYNLEQYICIMKYYNKPVQIIKDFEEITKSLENRNDLAHILSRMSDLNTNKISKLLKNIIIGTYGNKVKKESLHLYELINKKIKKML